MYKLQHSIGGIWRDVGHNARGESRTYVFKDEKHAPFNREYELRSTPYRIVETGSDVVRPDETFLGRRGSDYHRQTDERRRDNIKKGSGKGSDNDTPI